ncbi:MAG: NYN domain-containing protein [Patescibacteria group bacterium]
MVEKCILFIDGENFLYKLEDVLKLELGKGQEIVSINFEKLLSNLFKGIKVNRKIFYTAKLREYQEFPETVEKSRELIAKQRRLKTDLEKQGLEVVIAGNVRAQAIGQGKDRKIVFREKGVDVRIAVDMVSMSCDDGLKTAVLCSSDSDLQPAVAECKRRKVKVIYLGFELIPNKGLVTTADRTILIRNSEVKSAVVTRKKLGK